MEDIDTRIERKSHHEKIMNELFLELINLRIDYIILCNDNLQIQIKEKQKIIEDLKKFFENNNIKI